MKAFPPSAVNDRFTGDRLMLWQVAGISLLPTLFGALAAAAEPTGKQTARMRNGEIFTNWKFLLIPITSNELRIHVARKK